RGVDAWPARPCTHHSCPHSPSYSLVPCSDTRRQAVAGDHPVFANILSRASSLITIDATLGSKFEPATPGSRAAFWFRARQPSIEEMRVYRLMATVRREK